MTVSLLESNTKSIAHQNTNQLSIAFDPFEIQPSRVKSMPPYISTRAFIQWLPDGERCEPTATTVLTSSRRHFVDVRIFKDRPAIESLPPVALNSPDIDWAFAGTSASSKQNGKTLSQWHHWIDSTTTRPEDVVDKGEILPEDAEGLALEKGSMVNPATGRLTDYIEGWRDVEPLPVEPVRYPETEEIMHELRERDVHISQCTPGYLSDMAVDVTGAKTTSRLSLVVRHENAEADSRGMVVRLGHLCQGVMSVGDEFGLEQWEWRGSDRGWCKTHVLGDLEIPCDVLARFGETMKLGTRVEYGLGEEKVWECIEAEKF